MVFFQKMGRPQPLFRLFSVFSNKHQIQFLQQINVEKCNSIQYSAPAFEPTTFRTWVITHNHLTRAPARIYGVRRNRSVNWTKFVIQLRKEELKNR